MAGLSAVVLEGLSLTAGGDKLVLPLVTGEWFSTVDAGISLTSPFVTASGLVEWSCFSSCCCCC